jgi:hypothetical protein
MELDRSKLISSKDMKEFINEMKEIFYTYIFEGKKVVTENAKNLFLKHIDNNEEKMNKFFEQMSNVQDQYVQDL